MNAVWLTCPQCQHSWHQKVIETKRVKTDCRCDIMMDMETIETTWGGDYVNVVMKPEFYIRELGSFKRVKPVISNKDMIIA